MPRPGWIEIGYVARPHGIRGDVRIRLHNAGSTLLEELDRVNLEGPGDAGRRTVVIEEASPGGEHCRVHFRGVSDRDGAEALVGARVYVDRKWLPALEVGEYYHFDLIGLRAVDEAGNTVGTIEEIYDSTANDVYVVRGGAVEELLVPAVAAYVRGVDLEAGTITLTRLDDLIGE